MRKIDSSFAAALLAAAVLAARAPAQSVPWHLVEGSENLRGIHKEVVVEVLSTVPAYGGCEQTILRCLVENPENKIARRLANFVVRRVRAGNDVEDIAKEIEDRKLSAFPPEIREPDLGGLTCSGNAGAPVQVVIYADFGCPYCHVSTQTLRKLSREHPDQIAFYFKNFPLKSNPEAVPAALALLAAGRQGKFWEMNDLLFAKEENLCDDTYTTCAATLGLDVERFKGDMKNPELLARLREEKMEAIRYGVESTPGILVNGKFYRGVKTSDELIDRIEEEKDLLAAPTSSSKG